jgi:hypothetical protein
MKRILLLLLVSITSFAQSYKFSVGSNITSFVFTDASGTNSNFLRPASGMHLSLSHELLMSKAFYFEYGINYNQFNNVGDVQKIPFTYATDFIGIHAGIGPHLKLGKGFMFNPKANIAAAKMINGNQFLSNHYVDLFGDDQFNSLQSMFGYSLELSKQVNPQIGVFVKYHHLDSYKFGSSTLSIIPSTFSIGLSLRN